MAVGLDGTPYENSWDEGTLANLVAEPYYEPLVVEVNGVKARNITDYRSKEHPAFARTDEGTLEFQYLHIGRKLYFNHPLPGAKITVDFRYMAAYVQLQAMLRCVMAGRPMLTPALRSYKLMMQTARI